MCVGMRLLMHVGCTWHVTIIIVMQLKAVNEEGSHLGVLGDWLCLYVFVCVYMCLCVCCLAGGYSLCE